MAGSDQLERLAEAVSSYETEDAVRLAAEAMKAGVDPCSSSREAWPWACRLSAIGTPAARRNLPELMLAGETADAVVKVLEPALKASGGQRKVLGRIVIGTVKATSTTSARRSLA